MKFPIVSAEPHGSRREASPSIMNRMPGPHPASPARLVAGRRLCPLVLALLSLPVFGQEYLFEAREQEYDWSRNFRLGAVVGFNINADFRMAPGSYDVSGAREGVYTDGYVIKDSKDKSGEDFTSNWGYDNASQYDTVNRTLTFHRTSSFQTAGNHASDSAISVGAELAYGANLWKGERFRLGWEFAFGLVPIKITDGQKIWATNTISAFTYSVGDLDPVPGPGYQGNSSGRGPLIPSSQIGNPQAVSTGPGVQMTGSRTLDVILYTFSLGPTLYWDMAPDWALTAHAGAVLGFISGDYRYSEMIDQTPNRGSIAMSDVVFGANVGAMVLYNAEENGSLYLGVQYMPLGSSEVSDGQRSARLDLSGQVYITAGVSWVF